MIIAERKPLNEILDMLHGVAGLKKLLVVGCRECVTICFAGGEKEVAEVASALRIALKKEAMKIDIEEETLQRACENEFVDAISEKIKSSGVVLSLACGVGVQAIVERVPEATVFPGVNTTFYGRPTEPGIWNEYCVGCGNCILHLTEGICPIARCSKNLLNGPCGGSSEGKCEVDPNIDCVWQLIYERLKEKGKLENLEEIMPPKDWSTASYGGVRRISRHDVTTQK